ncbi:hypothetical protein [Enterobacter sp. Bisph1]|uniref:hypothetical protein n=1 Tax=Enterobacter sp. Bisph1 TaxID=1274399 RepID=UPI00057C1E06|nr:hypothetical protein [Enterobacter sp. Bisph1]
MVLKPRIDAKKHGVSVALHLKRDTELLSAKTVNKLLQIIYDDLRDIINVVYAARSEVNYTLPGSIVTANLARRFIIEAGERDERGMLVPEDWRYFQNWHFYTDTTCMMDGYESCHLLIKKMFSKCLFVSELEKAKTILANSPYLQSDPNRRQIEDFILRAEVKAKQQKNHAINDAMERMRTIGLFRSENLTAFKQIVSEYIAREFDTNKSTLTMNSYKMMMKRKVKHFILLDTAQLKERIDTILSDYPDSDPLQKEMALWYKLMQLGAKGDEKYQIGESVTLYFTGIRGELDWWTKEECSEKGYATLRPETRTIPSEKDYLLEVNRLSVNFNALQP